MIEPPPAGTTLGPWRVNARVPSVVMADHPEDSEEFIGVADCRTVDVSPEVAQANARLCAAAPELFDIAARYVAECEDTFIDPEEMSPECVALWKDAKAVIAKTLGSSEEEPSK